MKCAWFLCRFYDVILQEKALENLFVAGDANQDGVLTFTEFREIISSAEPSITQQNALRMFRETLVLMPDGGDSISPQAFAAVAHAHGIKAPTDIIFNLLKKTWDQVFKKHYHLLAEAKLNCSRAVQ